VLKAWSPGPGAIGGDGTFRGGAYWEEVPLEGT
jgi:hypothetical protein